MGIGHILTRLDGVDRLTRQPTAPGQLLLAEACSLPSGTNLIFQGRNASMSTYGSTSDHRCML
jgi:hypothetical protein